MSEIKDSFIYNYYDYFKDIYVYVHLKTYLLDKQVQTYEKRFLFIQLICIAITSIMVIFKFLLIIIYFFIIQSISIFKKILIACKKTKGHINILSNLKNGVYYVIHTLLKIYVYNFYFYNNRFIEILMCSSYICFIIINPIFLNNVKNDIEDCEKSIYFIFFHFLCNEISLLIEILCVTFYSSTKKFQQIVISLLFFVFFNCLNLMIYYFSYLYEESKGTIVNEEHKKIANIIFNTIFLVLYIDAILKTYFYNNKSKNIITIFYRGKF